MNTIVICEAIHIYYFLFSCRPGSLMVTFDVDTDGQQSEEEIVKLLKDTLTSGSFSGYRTSPEGFDFRRIRGNYKPTTNIHSSVRSLSSSCLLCKSSAN